MPSGKCKACLHRHEYNNNGSDCMEKCFDHNLFTIDPEKEKHILYVNCYEITRELGGDEEGGWWYNWREGIESVATTPDKVDQVKQEVLARWKKEEWGDIYSANGGVKIEVDIEDLPFESETKERPQYE